jgi:hypothetical protein
MNNKIELPIFESGTYNQPCELFNSIMIGSVLCTGHLQLAIKKCKYCVSFKEQNTYHLKILNENTPIVSEVICSRPFTQLKIF